MVIQVSERLERALAKEDAVDFAVLFGSTALGTQHPNSDLDVAVNLTKALDAWALGALAARLGEAAGRQVDLVVLGHSRSALLRKEIARGVRLKGSEADLVAFRESALRGWRMVEGRFRRCAHAVLHSGRR